ncbi:MAG: hypothetical protein ACRDGQ_05730 [Candidatus Limnocylindrales bacterium]
MAGSEADGLPQPMPSSPAPISPDAPAVPPLPAPADRPLELRLASIHLRTGALALARAELETSAGRGELDDSALLDLAEVRWRTDDVTGAGEAAAAYFATGREDTLALVIATEATASIGRSTEARRLAARALARGDVALDLIFRGIRPSSYWPPTSALAGEPAGTLFGGPRPGSTIGTAGVTGAAVLGRLAAADAGVDDPAGSPGSDPDRPLSGVAPVVPAGGNPTAGPLTPTLWAETEMQPLSDDADLDRARRLPEPTAEIEAARADLAGGRAASAAVRLAIVLRVAPDLASTVLELLSAGPAANALSGPAHVASIELVRGDALRLAGREAEARRAYAAAAALLVEPAQ